MCRAVSYGCVLCVWLASSPAVYRSRHRRRTEVVFRSREFLISGSSSVKFARFSFLSRFSTYLSE